MKRGLSQRGTIYLIGCNLKTARYLSKHGQDVKLREQLKTLAYENPAWGYKLLWRTLRVEGFIMNLKKLYRLYKVEQLQLRRKGKKRLKSEGSGLPQAATQPNQEWCLNFVHDALSDGRSFRSLTMLDACTRQCLHIECDTSLSSERVMHVLKQ